MRLLRSVPQDFTRNQMTDLIWGFPGTMCFKTSSGKLVVFCYSFQVQERSLA